MRVWGGKSACLEGVSTAHAHAHAHMHVVYYMRDLCTKGRAVLTHLTWKSSPGLAVGGGVTIM